MTQIIGRNTNSNDTAILSDVIPLNTITSTVVAAPNPNRIFFSINNNNDLQGVWVKLQAASVDNDQKGIFVGSKSFWEMPSDNIYTGEISAIADVANPDIFTTEY